MADYTIRTDAGEEAALSAKVAEINTRRAEDTPPKPPITNQQYLTARNKDLFRDYIRQEREKEVPSQTLAEAFRDATPAQRAAARTALGL